ncbi:MAG TPA: response regulator, partial [Blastocatellia bacterium]
AFRLLFPLTNHSSAVTPAETTDPLQLRGRETVLVVEDESLVRGLVRKILEGFGYTILEAAGGADALALCDCHQGPLDLVLADVVMPGMSGRELATRLRERHPGLKLLFMSGYAGGAIASRGLAELGAPLINKPFTPSSLATKLRETLDCVRVVTRCDLNSTNRTSGD